MDNRAGKNERTRRRIGWLLAALVALAAMSQPAQELFNLPSSLRITQGSVLQLDCSLPISASARGAQVETANGQVEIRASGSGDGSVTLRLMGILPVKTMSVSVAEEKMLIPGGNLIGVALETEGVLLVGTSDVASSQSPARAAGLRSGDAILRADGVLLEDAQQFARLVEESGGKPISLTVRRENELLQAEIVPQKDTRDGAWRIGAWVRDSTAGVGTLTFIDPQTRTFGALGHAISDIDTGTRMPLGKGEIYEGAVAEIHRGAAGNPGEIVGSFFDGARFLGTLTKNTDYGVFGAYQAQITADPVPILRRSEVKIGPAVIRSQVDNGPVREYDCEIVRVSNQSTPAQRSLVLRITDEELLQKTGGIVQGMSGSPILQNGRLLGAVTHVFVNDPAMGYGIFIETMLDAAA